MLEVAYDIDAVLHLGGRGLRLVPSYFCQRTSVTLADPELPPVLIYPIDHQHHWSTVVRRGVEPLLGRTRAAALLAVATSAPHHRRARPDPADLPRLGQPSGDGPARGRADSDGT
ncbi:hypothetical protein ACFSTC_40365 [Nonomuraea ferruginea]